MSAAPPRPALVFAQIGDLHVRDARERNYGDLLAIAAQIGTECGDAIDFVLLPGDNADDGLPSQYALAATAMRLLGRPVHAIPGDHDVASGGLGAFRAFDPRPLPRAETVRGVRCLFLDASGPGSGGPDFRLGADQLGWLAAELAGAEARGERAAVAMHCYPADLRGEGERDAVCDLFARHDVAIVAMGHTHYNDIGNDGRTVFAATRSTGQIEEGPPGYAILAVDGDAVSWRFKPLDDPFPFVVVTAPADRRLARDGAPTAGGPMPVRALVLGREPAVSVSCRAGEGPWSAMVRDPHGRAWSGAVDVPDGAAVPITVRALSAGGRPGEHTIAAAGVRHVPPARRRDGSDADSIGAWPENGVNGTRLGPNRNGRPWGTSGLGPGGTSS